MTPCEALSERMPEVARGAGQWSSAESAHLAACAECAAEWRLVVLAVGTPARVPVNAHRVAAAVRARRSQAGQPGVRPFLRRPLVRAVGLLSAAALLMFAVRPALLERRVPPGPDEVLTELGELDPGELDLLLEEWVPGPAAPPVAAFVSGLADLSVDELETILQGLET